MTGNLIHKYHGQKCHLNDDIVFAKYMHIHIIYTYLYTYIYIDTNIHAYLHTDIYTQTHIYAFIWMHMCICIYICIFMSLYLYQYSTSISISISSFPSKLKTHMLNSLHETSSWVYHRHLQFNRSKAEPLISYNSNRFSSNNLTSHKMAQLVTQLLKLELACLWFLPFPNPLHIRQALWMCSSTHVPALSTVKMPHFSATAGLTSPASIDPFCTAQGIWAKLEIRSRPLVNYLTYFLFQLQ